MEAAPVRESDDRRDLRSSVRDLLARRLPATRALELDATLGFDRDLWSELGAAGLLGLGATEEQGGSGGTVGDSLVVVEEVAAVLPSLAVDFVLGGMAMRLLGSLADAAAPGSPLRTWLPAVAGGDLIASFAMSEPGVGTDLLGLSTSARLEGDHWILNGRKTWISLANHAGLLLVLARTDPVEDGRRAHGLSLLAVDPDQPGVEVRKVAMAGMRAAQTCEVFLDDAVAPRSHLVGERGRALRLLGETLDVERVLAGGISLGIARGALEQHVAYARDRHAFGRPIGALQAVQHPAADSAAEVAASRALLDVAVREIEQGNDAAVVSALAKLQTSETAARVVDRGMRAMGAMGLAQESTMQMFFRDARLQLFSPVSNEMIRNIVGESLDLPRSY